MNVKEFSKTNDGEIQIAPNFKIKEFACHDGTDKILIDYELLSLLQLIRDITNNSINVNSGYRTQSYNKSVGGATNSYHLYGRAFDISSSVGKDCLANIANSIGIKGIIHYNDFIHIDSRDNEYHYNMINDGFNFEKVDIPYQGILLYNGLTNYLIGCIQFKLNQLGYECGTVDWIFGNKTKNAVVNFQSDNNLSVDGIVGNDTWNALFNR